MSGGPGTADPGQFHAFGASLWDLFVMAHHISQYQVVSPGWMKSARLDVVAKVPAGATRDEFNIMLQKLLAVRFKITLHREHKELPAYHLVIAKGGLKIKRVATDPASKDESAPPVGTNPAKFTTGKDGYPVLQLEPGATSGTAMAQNGRLTDWMGKLTMAQFAATMSARTGRPVFDRTGLSGRYDITLRFWWNVPAGADDSGEP